MNLPLSDAKLLRNGAYVDGNWIESTAHGSYALRNPATGEILPSCLAFK